MRGLRRRLIVPALLTATALAPACRDDKPPSTDTRSDTGSSAATMARRARHRAAVRRIVGE